jgi:tape measure domain-containing protein
MSRILANLVVNIGANLAPLKSILGQAQGMALGMQLSKGIDLALSGMRGLFAAGIGVNAELEQMTAGFEVMLGSQEKAVKLMGDIRKFAAETPFESPAVAQLATQLLATKKIAEDKVMPAIRKLGDAAAGSAKGFEALPRIGLAISQMLGKGKITAQDMNQIAEAGIPAWSALAEATGKSEAQLREMSESGKLGMNSVLMLIDALGKRFDGMAVKQSRTYKGLFSTIKDNFSMGLGRVFEPIFNRLKKVLEWVADFTKSPDFTAWTDRLAAGMEWFGKMAEAGVKGLLSGIELAIKAVTFFGEHWKTIWDFVVAQGIASVSLLWDRFKYLLNEQVPFAIVAMWEGALAGGRKWLEHLGTEMKAWMDFFKDLFIAVFDSISVRFQGLMKAWEQVKAGKLGNAFEELVKGNAAGDAALAGGAVNAASNFAATMGGMAVDIGAAVADAVGEVMSAMPGFEPSDRTKGLQGVADEIGKRLGEAWNAAGMPNLFKAPEKPAGAPGGNVAGAGGLEDTGKGKVKSEFLALDELNKKIQSSITDKEAKDRKKAIAAAERGADAGERVAVSTNHINESMRTLPQRIATEVNLGYVA